MSENVNGKVETERLEGIGGATLKGRLEKDATRYEMLFIPIEDLGLGALGHVSKGFLVINGLTKMSYLFHNHYQSYDYLGEKLFPRDWPYTTDVKNVKILFDAMQQKMREN